LSKDIFIATVAYELRQPVAAMLPAIVVMRERASAQSGTRARDVIERQVTRLRRMVDDLLDISRVAKARSTCTRNASTAAGSFRMIWLEAWQENLLHAENSAARTAATMEHNLTVDQVFQ
jgi:signal transduction histidine kinase